MTAFFPWVYDVVMGAAERAALGGWRRWVLRPARGHVIEIAAGTGLNFPYYAADALVVATDVDPAMLARARRRADRAAARIVLVAADASALPFRGGAFDTGVVGLALCTIPDPEEALGEVRRVLRPGAGLQLLEHVRRGGLVGRLQDWLTPAWQRVAGGCHLNRETEAAIVASRFTVDETRRHAAGVFVAIRARAS